MCSAVLNVELTWIKFNNTLVHIHCNSQLNASKAVKVAKFRHKI